MGRYFLPHGARGIEGEDFAIEFHDDKAVFVPKGMGPGKHYTFHAGPDSGVLDVHETTYDAEGQEQHRTLFAMLQDDLPAILGQFVPIVEELLGMLRPLRLGWLRRNDIAIVRGVDPVSDADI